jgi:hypothetical protein
MADIVTKEWVEKVRKSGTACVVEDGSVLTALCDSWLAMHAENDRFRDGLRRLCNLVYPYRGEHDARRCIAEAEAIRKNLVDGKAWDGKPVGG